MDEFVIKVRNKQLITIWKPIEPIGLCVSHASRGSKVQIPLRQKKTLKYLCSARRIFKPLSLKKGGRFLMGNNCVLDDQPDVTSMMYVACTKIAVHEAAISNNGILSKIYLKLSFIQSFIFSPETFKDCLYKQEPNINKIILTTTMIMHISLLHHKLRYELDHVPKEISPMLKHF
ncbi:hypothetical protein BpHYR1_000393 [Brachionus plicatilis]|uniref:Uncharacterized protein n=1 Tax=Brachionus plicatilis TaxID=10195 RepID=A0A3M7Q5J2_BRAPC|nr:hypothetical protein BpHYR1_000393 [Brachionus plicatilis]